MIINYNYRYKPREFVDTTAGSMYILALFLSIICWATKVKQIHNVILIKTYIEHFFLF